MIGRGIVPVISGPGRGLETAGTFGRWSGFCRSRETRTGRLRAPPSPLGHLLILDQMRWNCHRGILWLCAYCVPVLQGVFA